MNTCDNICRKKISRRSLIQFGGTVVTMVGCNALLSGCDSQNSPEVTTDPNKSPEQFYKEVRQYNIFQTDDLMEIYDAAQSAHKAYLNKHFSQEKVDYWLKQSRNEYKKLIPKIPYVGGDGNDLTRYLLMTSTSIPLVKLMRDEGIDNRKIGHMIVTTAGIAFEQEVPWFVKWFLRWRYFSDWGKRSRRSAATKSQQKFYPADWVFHYIEGDGSTFEYGVTYTECALQKFWTIQGLKEYAPYLCLCDYAIWREIGTEVTRTKTLANGANECDFKYIKKGSNVPPAWPPESHPEWTGRYEKSV